MALESLLSRLRGWRLGPFREPRYDPESIARLLGRAAAGSGLRSGHVHIHVEGYADHLMLFWRDSRLRMVAAKSPGQGEGRFSHLSDSEFSAFPGREVLRELRAALGAVGMHAPLPERSWPSFEAFADWLAGQER